MTKKEEVEFKKEELEQEARIALLQHFSSKSSNQVTNGLTIALGFFAFIMAIEPLRTLFGEGSISFLYGLSLKMLCDIFSAIILYSLMALGVHTLSRLLYWGELASLVLSCEMASPETTLKRQSDREKEPTWIKKNIVEKMKTLGYSGNRSPDSISFYIARLSIGCSDLYGAKHLTKPKNLTQVRFSFRYARWRESLIVSAIPFAVYLILLVVNQF